jgi:hypothetical protein
MKKSQFAVKILMLRQAKKGTSLGEIGCKRGISKASDDNSREKYARVTTWEMLELRLEAENDQLKKIASRLLQENEMLRRQSVVPFNTQIKVMAG